MIRPEPDQRSTERRGQDEQIAAEPKLPFSVGNRRTIRRSRRVETHLADSGDAPQPYQESLKNGLSASARFNGDTLLRIRG